MFDKFVSYHPFIEALETRFSGFRVLAVLAHFVDSVTELCFVTELGFGISTKWRQIGLVKIHKRVLDSRCDLRLSHGALRSRWLQSQSCKPPPLQSYSGCVMEQQLWLTSAILLLFVGRTRSWNDGFLHRIHFHINIRGKPSNLIPIHLIWYCKGRLNLMNAYATLDWSVTVESVVLLNDGPQTPKKCCKPP